MQGSRPKPVLKRVVLKAILVFLISYFVFLVLWVQAKDYYGYGITYAASHLATLVRNVRFEEMKRSGSKIVATFSPSEKMKDLLIDIPVRTSSYTFNVPLTLGIMAALFAFIGRRKRAFSEGLLVLLGVHLLYVFSLEANTLTSILNTRALESVSKPVLFGFQGLWEFTNNMVIRFEPFLIGFYIFLRFRRAVSSNV